MPLEIEAQDGTVAAVDGSEVRVELQTSRVIASAEMDGAPLERRPDTMQCGALDSGRDSGTQSHLAG